MTAWHSNLLTVLSINAWCKIGNWFQTSTGFFYTCKNDVFIKTYQMYLIERFVMIMKNKFLIVCTR